MKQYTKILVGIMVIVLAVCVHTTCLAKTVTVDTETLKLRAEPSTESAVIRLLSIGDELTYLEETEGWVKIEFEGSTGYVSKDYVKIEGEEETPSQEQTPTQTPETTTEQPTTETQEEQGSTNNSYQIKNECSMYILPLINASQIYTFTPGTECTVITEQNGWVYVQTSQIDGWLRKDNIEEKKETQTITPPQEQTPTQTPETPQEQPTTTFEEKTMYVSEDSIFVRGGPGTNYEVVEYLAINDAVTVKGEEGDWYKVTVSGQDGYIAKWLLTETVPELTSRGGEVQRAPEEETQTSSAVESTPVVTSSVGEQVVEYAKQFLGRPYVYGGSGPNNFDCSGFTMYVYKNFGVSLTHSATAQSLKGTYVAKEELQLGDLVFFKDYETMDGIGHCGIYIGDGNFIHASSGTGYCVKISTLLTGSYNTRYETARRII